MAGLSLCLLLAIGGAVTWRAARDDDTEPSRAGAPTAAPVAVRPGAAAQVLQRLATALADGDRAAAAALAADDRVAARLRAMVDAAAAARLRGVTLRYVEEQGGAGADGTWAAAVDAAWAYGGFDDVATTGEVLVRFAADDDDGAVTIADVGGGLRTPVWMAGPVDVARGPGVLVVADAGRDADLYLRRARAALPTVTAVLDRWRPRLVVEVPADDAGLERALDVEPGLYAQIAAVSGAGGDADEPVHVFLNPDVFDGLGRSGQGVVLAHEVTHVAADAAGSAAPTWLVEGFADYVALRDTSLPLTITAGQVAARVRADGLPRALPSGAAFDTRGPHLGAVYEAAWLVCETLAARGGADALETLYRRVSAGRDLGADLRRGFGWTEADLLAAWRERLAALPGAGR